MLFAVAACDNENEVSEVLDPIQQMQIELITNATDQAQKILDEYGDYDRSAAASLLTNKVFEYSGYVEYDEGWNEIIGPGDAFGEISLDGGHHDWYRFEEDGTLAYRLRTWLTPEGEYLATGTWSFDPETDRSLSNKFFVRQVFLRCDVYNLEDRAIF